MRLLVLLTILLSGCASLDSKLLDGSFIRLEPIKTDADYNYYRFVAPAMAGYPVDTVEGEAARMGWLRDRLRSDNYVIKSRLPVFNGSNLIGGDSYNVFYDVMVPK
jgi:hypothetical protein